MSEDLTYGFTETELDIAKHTDLLSLLPSLGYTLKRIGSYYTSSEESPLCSVPACGEVSKTGCNVVTYTAIFGSTEAPKDSGVQDGEPVDVSGIRPPLMIGGLVLALGPGGLRLRDACQLPPRLR